MEPPTLYVPELRSFDPSQPRGHDGRWSAGGAAPQPTIIPVRAGLRPAPLRLRAPVAASAPARSASAPPPPPSPAAEHLRIAAIAAVKPQGVHVPGDETTLTMGSNKTSRVTFADGSEAVFKPRAGERSEAPTPVRDPRGGGFARRPDGEIITVMQPPRTNVTPGTYYQREAAGYEVARAMGLDLVPPTTIREINGQVGSVQQVVKGEHLAIPEDGPPRSFPREQAEKLRAFDFIAGNSDRPWSNVLVEGDQLHAIDHGLAFPRGAPDRFIQPLPFIAGHTGPLAESTRTWLAGLEPRAIAGAMARAGIEREAAEHALRRLVHLQSHPELLEIRPEPGENSLKAAQRMERGAQTAGHAIAAGEGVSPAHVHAAYSAMEEAYAGR